MGLVCPREPMRGSSRDQGWSWIPHCYGLSCQGGVWKCRDGIRYVLESSSCMFLFDRSPGGISRETSWGLSRGIRRGVGSDGTGTRHLAKDLFYCPRCQEDFPELRRCRRVGTRGKRWRENPWAGNTMLLGQVLGRCGGSLSWRRAKSIDGRVGRRYAVGSPRGVYVVSRIGPY